MCTSIGMYVLRDMILINDFLLLLLSQLAYLTKPTQLYTLKKQMCNAIKKRQKSAMKNKKTF